jgi:hypothetical protein
MHPAEKEEVGSGPNMAQMTHYSIVAPAGVTVQVSTALVVANTLKSSPRKSGGGGRSHLRLVRSKGD